MSTPNIYHSDNINRTLCIFWLLSLTQIIFDHVVTPDAPGWIANIASAMHLHEIAWLPQHRFDVAHELQGRHGCLQHLCKINCIRLWDHGACQSFDRDPHNQPVPPSALAAIFKNNNNNNKVPPSLIGLLLSLKHMFDKFTCEMINTLKENVWIKSLLVPWKKQRSIEWHFYGTIGLVMGLAFALSGRQKLVWLAWIVNGTALPGYFSR